MSLPNLTEMTRREIEDYLVERSLIDPAFRSRLLKEPRVLLQELGLPVGGEVKIQVFEEEPKSFYLVLPRVLREPEALNEEELDSISGGLSSDRGAPAFFKGYC